MRTEQEAQRNTPTRRAVVVHLAAIGVYGLSGRTAAADPVRIRIGAARSVGSAPLYLALLNGYFAEEGLDPQLSVVDSEALIPGLVGSRQIDIGAASLDAAFFGEAANQRLKLIASQFSDQAGFPANALVISKSAYEAGFRGVKDLPKKRIGMTTAGSGLHYAMVQIANRFKLDPAEMNFVWLETPAREIAAFSGNEIDAAALPFAAALELRSTMKDAVIVRVSDLAQWQQGAVFAAAQTIESERPLVEKFMRAYRKGAAAYDLTFLQRTDGGMVIKPPQYQEALAYIANQAGIAPDALEQAIPYCDRLARLDAADVGNQLKFWQDQGMVDKQISAADLLDQSFLGDGVISAPQPN